MGVENQNSAAYWLSFGPFQLFPAERSLTRSGMPVRIGDRALDLLIALTEHPGEILSKAELFERIWGKTWVEEANLRVTVAALRKVLGDAGGGEDYIVNIAGRGYSFSGATSVELRTPSPDATTPSPMADGEQSICRLPTLLNRVIGRDETVRQILELLDAHKLVTVIGPGGIGKTTVAIMAAATRHRADEQICFVDLSPNRDSDLVATKVAAALGADNSTLDPTGWLLNHLASARLFLLLDNCEHVAGAVAAISEQILRRAPGVTILATSREALRAEGEVIYRVECLLYPQGDDGLNAKSAMAFPAVQLFVDRLQAGDPAFVLSDAQAPLASEICRRLDGVALAIQLAASRVAAFGIAGVASRLDDRFQLLTQGRRTALPRHRTLEAALDWSYELLSEQERRVFQRLAVFAGGFSLEAATEVVATAPLSKADIATTVADLVDKSLVIFNAIENPPRYHLLETARAYASSRLAASGERDRISLRHAEYVLGVCRRFQPSVGVSSKNSDWSSALEAGDDLRSAFGWVFAQADQAPLAAELVAAAVPMLLHLGLTLDARVWIQRALENEGAPNNRLRLLIAMAGAVLLSKGDSTLQMRLYGEAHDLAIELNDQDGALQSLWGLMITQWAARCPRGALISAKQFHEFARESRRANDVLIGGRLMASALHVLGEHAEAERNLVAMLREYPVSARAKDAQRFLFDQIVVALTFKASIEWMTGRFELATRTAAQAVKQAEETDHVPSLYFALANAACPIALHQGEWRSAQTHINEFYKRCGHQPGWRLWADALQAVLEISADGSATAISKLGALLANPESSQLNNYRLWFNARHAEALLATGDFCQAGTLIDESISAARSTEEYWLLPDLLRLKGAAGAASAERSLFEALELSRSQGAVAWELKAANELGAHMVRSGQRAAAEKLVAETYAKLKEGFDTPDAQAARQILAGLHPSHIGPPL